MDKTFLQLFAEMQEFAERGVIVVLKVDGARAMAGAAEIFTVILSGGDLGSECVFREDGSDLVGLMRTAINFYAANRRSI